MMDLRWATLITLCAVLGCTGDPASGPSEQPVTTQAPSTPTHSSPAAYDPTLKNKRGFATAAEVDSGTLPLQDEEKRIELTVRLEGIGMASGGNPAQWRGFNPREMFFKARWEKDGVQRRFRIRTQTPDEGKRLLGRMVRVTGQWMVVPTVRSTSAIQTSAPPIGLEYAKGQELYEVVKKQRRDKVRNVLGVQDGESINLEGWSQVSQTPESIQMPVFIADTLEPLRTTR